VNKVSDSDFKEPLEQCVGYAKEHKIGIYLVNFVTEHQAPERTDVIWDSDYRVTVVNVHFSDDYCHFTVKCGKRIEKVEVSECPSPV
jgi:hypothetical protein